MYYCRICHSFNRFLAGQFDISLIALCYILIGIFSWLSFFVDKLVDGFFENMHDLLLKIFIFLFLNNDVRRLRY